MAAAEARAAWQRTANRCLVQEDAKRAPKLACCPSSSPLQHDSSNGNATDGQEHLNPTFVPLNWSPMYSNLPPDTRWWLQLQPSSGFKKDFASGQLNVLEDELRETGVEFVVPASTLSRERLDNKNRDDPYESPWMISTAFMKKDSETIIDEMRKVTKISEQPLKRKVDTGDYLFQDEEFMDWRPGDRLISKKTEKVTPELDSPWAGGGNKCEPWWRISDRDELASLVAQKSLEHIENCDLPRPTQTVHVSRDPFACLESLDGNRMFLSSVSHKLHSNTCEPLDYPQHSTTSVSMDEKYWSSSDTSHLASDTERLCRTCGPATKDTPEKRQTSESDPSRAQLLEALRHSQTRAREAEIAAQKAYNEKEHIIKLFFRQASHLFAYKQWLQMLQLESLCLQLKIKENQISTLFPVLPWMPLKGDKTKSKGKKPKKCSLCKYAVAFAVGLGLAGAGLLLGWTLGWLLPHL